MQGWRAESLQELFDGPPGGYAHLPLKGEGMQWWIKTPAGDLGRLSKHEVVEHEDGTITVSPSILVSTPKGEAWHGFLERGIWREA